MIGHDLQRVVAIDLGRPVSDLVVNLDYDSLVEDAQEVLRTLVFAEREVQTRDQEWRLMRILPYRTANNVIDGLIITVTDIQRFKEAQRQMEDARSLMDDVLASMPLPLVIVDQEFRILVMSVEFARRFGSSETNLVGKALADLGPGWRQPAVTQQLELLVRGEPCPMFRVQGNFGATFPLDLLVHPRRLRKTHTAARYVLVLQEASAPLPPAINAS